MGERSWLDTCTRGTYDLLCAACDTGGVTERVVVLSTLSIFDHAFFFYFHVQAPMLDQITHVLVGTFSTDDAILR